MLSLIPPSTRDVGAHGAAVEGDLLDRADRVDGAHRRADDRAAGLDREPRHRRCRAPGTRARRSCSSRWRAARGRTGRPGSCRRCRSRRRGPSRAASTPSSSETRACSASTRRAATSKPEESKIWLPMWECRPSSSRPGAAPRPAYRLEGVAAGDREAELLVLVGGGDVLVGVRLDAGGHPDHHPAGARRARLGRPRASRSISWKESTMIRPTPERRRPARARRAVLLLPWKPIRAGSKPGRSGDGQLAAGADVEAAAPPRRPSARPSMQRNALPA